MRIDIVPLPFNRSGPAEDHGSRSGSGVDVVEELWLMELRDIPRQQKATTKEPVSKLAGSGCDAGGAEILTDA
jgi:hypothetical protein